MKWLVAEARIVVAAALVAATAALGLAACAGRADPTGDPVALEFKLSVSRSLIRLCQLVAPHWFSCPVEASPPLPPLLSPERESFNPDMVGR